MEVLKTVRFLVLFVFAVFAVIVISFSMVHFITWLISVWPVSF